MIIMITKEEFVDILSRYRDRMKLLENFEKQWSKETREEGFISPSLVKEEDFFRLLCYAVGDTGTVDDFFWFCYDCDFGMKTGIFFDEEDCRCGIKSIEDFYDFITGDVEAWKRLRLDDF